MEYKGFEILVHPRFVVLGDDPMAAPTEGFAAEICKKDPVQDEPEGRVVWDYPLGMSASVLEGATEEEVVQKAKAFIDGGGKTAHDFQRRRDE